MCHTIYTYCFAMEEKKNKKTLRGVAVSTKMQDTVVVAVDRYVKHPIYGKYRRVTKRYKAHCPGNTVSVGDAVTIESCRPVSKEKRFQVVL